MPLLLPLVTIDAMVSRGGKNKSSGVDDLQLEAKVFGSYLLKIPIGPEVRQRYIRILEEWNVVLADTDKKQLTFARKHPWSISFLDGANALLRPQAELRRRIYLLFAILEATPDYSDYFLPQKQSELYFFPIILVACRAGLKTAGGLLLLPLVRVLP